MELAETKRTIGIKWDIDEALDLRECIFSDEGLHSLTNPTNRKLIWSAADMTNKGFKLENLLKTRQKG